MDYFNYKNNELYCEGVSLAGMAKKYGTPLYIYSYSCLKDQFNRFRNAFGKIDVLVCYSMKANSNGAVLKTFIKEGGGIDVVAGGELYRALEAGCDPEKIVFSGVGKTDEEIRSALKAKILQFNVESEMELENIQKIASSMNKKAPIALRVNPDVDPKTHAYISTGLKKNKFGIEDHVAVELYKKAMRMSHVEIVGIDCHIGSQLTMISPFVDAAEKIADLIKKLKKEGIEIKNLDFGGGLGITYTDETPPTPEEYANAIIKVFKGLQIKLILEPGRFLVGNAGVLLTKVIYNKIGELKKFVIVDAASNDLMRPSLYGALHQIQPVRRDSKRDQIIADVVGPICETGDFLAKDREMQQVNPGELMAVMSAGAYCQSMASTYNSRPGVAEVMVKEKESFLIKERETFGDLIRGEKVPGFLK